MPIHQLFDNQVMAPLPRIADEQLQQMGAKIPQQHRHNMP